MSRDICPLCGEFPHLSLRHFEFKSDLVASSGSPTAIAADGTGDGIAGRGFESCGASGRADLTAGRPPPSVLGRRVLGDGSSVGSTGRRGTPAYAG